MAFVYRSERNMKLDLMEENDSAPGLYELTTSFQKSEPNVAPFNSLVKRNKNSFVPKNETPGPGTYEKEYQYLEPHQREKLKDKNLNLIQTVEKTVLPKRIVELFKERGKIAFNTRGERFNYTNDLLSTDTFPGPGSYEVSTSFSSMNNSNINRKNNIKNREVFTTGSIYRKTTIPSKENFGYERTKDGIEKMIDDPEKDIKFSGEKNDTVGPGQYDINSTWSANVLKWKNSEEKNSKSLSKEKDKKSFETNNKREYKQNNDKKVLLKYYLNKRYDTVRAIKEKREHSPTDFIFNAPPGPGYYTQEIDNDWKVKRNSNGVIQSFDSTSPRFQEKQKTKNDLGPGFYYNFSHPKEIIKPKYKIGKLLGSSNKELEKISAYNIVMNKNDDKNKIGPGSYDISGNLMKKKFGNFDGFGFKEKRFNYKITEESPGPGYYLGNNDDNNNNKENKKIPHLIKKSIASDEKNIKYERYQPPPIGTYNPGLVLSMNYKVQSSINTNQDNKKVGFGSQERRFEYKEKGDYIGPGVYYRNISQEVKQNAAPFNENNERFSYNKNDKMPVPGPGSYELSNLNEWDKKSFNILFV